MPEPGEIKILRPTGELHTCPACGYALGSHTSFVNASATRDNPVRSTRETWRVILICPECGARFDVGWRISFAEFESTFIWAPPMPVVAVKAVPHPPATQETPAAAQLPPPENPDQPPEA